MLKWFKTASVAAMLASLVAGPALSQTSPPSGTAPAMKMTQADCQSLWNTLDSAKSGSVMQSQAQTHISDFKAVDTNNDGKLSQAEFQAGCDKGSVHSTASTGAASGSTTPTAPK